MTASSMKNWKVFISAMALTGIVSFVWYQAVGITDESISTTIRYSGQLAFVIFLAVLVARPLQQLVQADWTAALRRNRRMVGVAFAGVMAAHLVMIVMRLRLTPDLNFPPQTLVFGGIAYALTGLMFITSFDPPARALGPKAWKWLHRIGLIWISFIFAAPSSVEDLSSPGYLKFGIPFAIALVIRITAWQRSRQRNEASH